MYSFAELLCHSFLSWVLHLFLLEVAGLLYRFWDFFTNNYKNLMANQWVFLYAFFGGSTTHLAARTYLLIGLHFSLHHKYLP